MVYECLLWLLIDNGGGMGRAFWVMCLFGCFLLLWWILGWIIGFGICCEYVWLLVV